MCERERERYPDLLSKIVITKAERRTGYQGLHCTALINSHFIESALHYDHVCVDELVCGNTTRIMTRCVQVKRKSDANHDSAVK